MLGWHPPKACERNKYPAQPLNFRPLDILSDDQAIYINHIHGQGEAGHSGQADQGEVAMFLGDLQNKDCQEQHPDPQDT